MTVIDQFKYFRFCLTFSLTFKPCGETEIDCVQNWDLFQMVITL